MSTATPRMRMFAGPNGSGKSTLKSVLPPELLGVYINPDEIEREIRTRRVLDFSAYGIAAAAERALQFFRHSTLWHAAGLTKGAASLVVANSRLEIGALEVNSYLASIAADFLRQELLERRISFTFETVMSSPDKVSLLERARSTGYRTYLYYIATDDPQINISRVRYRVSHGGHAVPEDKIVSRYHRSLSLLMDAIRRTDRAYIFDNSGENRARTWLAEITGGRVLELKVDQIPAWFKHAVLDKIISSGGPV